jgi:hypothetical protein
MSEWIVVEAVVFVKQGDGTGPVKKSIKIKISPCI